MTDRLTLARSIINAALLFFKEVPSIDSSGEMRGPKSSQPSAKSRNQMEDGSLGKEHQLSPSHGEVGRTHFHLKTGSDDKPVPSS